MPESHVKRCRQQLWILSWSEDVIAHPSEGRKKGEFLSKPFEIFLNLKNCCFQAFAGEDILFRFRKCIRHCFSLKIKKSIKQNPKRILINTVFSEKKKSFLDIYFCISAFRLLEKNEKSFFSRICEIRNCKILRKNAKIFQKNANISRKTFIKVKENKLLMMI